MDQGFSSAGRMGGPPGYGQPAGIPQHGPPPFGPSPQGVLVNQAQPQVVNVLSSQTFGTTPVSLTCQFCKNPVTTVVQKKCNCCTCCLCWATGLCFFICIQSCRKKEIGCNDATHTCPSCGQILGTYNSC